MPTAIILSQGDEVITGQVADTNAAWLATRLTELGFFIQRHVSVGDHLNDLVQAIREACDTADVVICTGGLGPTEDDLTAEAVATGFHRPLQLDEHALTHIQQLYARYNRVMPEINKKQAYLPTGSVRLDNDWGTAPGFAIDKPAFLACMPGVPREMKKLFDVRVVPLLVERFALTPGRLVTLRTTGIGESNLQERIQGFSEPGITLSFRTKLPENHLKLRVDQGVDVQQLHQAIQTLMDQIGSPVFSIEGAPRPLQTHADQQGGDLAQVVASAMTTQGLTLATAESCTGGRIGSLCTGMPGSSKWFMEGVITYANEAKVRHCGVETEQLIQHGAVSEPVCRQMAEGIRAAAGTTFGLATTGIAGPGGATETKPVGLVHIALATPSQTIHRCLTLGGNRARVQTLTAAAALDLLRRHLQNIL